MVLTWAKISIEIYLRHCVNQIDFSSLIEVKSDQYATSMGGMNIQVGNADDVPVPEWSMNRNRPVQRLDHFLSSVEKRALRMAQLSTGDAEVALDIVQDAMLKLVQNYADKTELELRPLFYRILANRIKDWHRHQNRRWMIFDRWFGRSATGDEIAEEESAIEQLAGDLHWQPDRQVASEFSRQALERAVSALSLRQQQAFMLRCWEGASTAETAVIMGCTEGTVKTLYARSLTFLRQHLEDHYE